MNIARTPVLVVAATLVAGASYADMRQTAKDFLKTHSDAVIELEVVQEFQMSMGGDSRVQENEERSAAVVVDAKGTVITALSSVDPTSLFERMGGPDETPFTVDVKDTRYIMADGTEVPATLVFRDPDLDIAVLTPKEPSEEPFAFIDTAKSAEATIMDETFTLGRAGRIANRTPVARSGEIVGMVERPRAYYLPSSSLQEMGPGSPVFSESGDFLGLLLLRVLPNAPEGEEPFAMVIVPALDIAESLAQAMEKPAGATESADSP